MAGFAALLTKQNIEITEMMTAAIMHNTAMQQQTDSSPHTLQQWLAYCEQLHPQGIQGIELGLDRLRSVASRMHNGAGVRFDCPVFTVAGTNGKGSSCTMLESILRHAGYRTGLFTSPHLVHFTERCKINNQPVDEATLAQRFSRHLFEEGLFAMAIGFPTVPMGKARIRVMNSAAHSPAELEQAIAIFERTGRALGVI